jgi:hypothetical protein
VRRRHSSRPRSPTGVAGPCLHDPVDQELARSLLDLPRVLLNLPCEPVQLLLPCPRARASASPLPPVELLCPYCFCSSARAAVRAPARQQEEGTVRSCSSAPCAEYDQCTIRSCCLLLFVRKNNVN